jgi:hypothetical protein
MEGNTSCGNTFNDGHEVPVPGFDLLNGFLITVDKRAYSVTDPQLDALGKREN